MPEQAKPYVLGGGLSGLAAASLGLEMIGGMNELAPTGEEIVYYAHAFRTASEKSAAYYRESGAAKARGDYSGDSLRAYQFWTQGLPEVEACMSSLAARGFLNQHAALGRPVADTVMLCEEHSGILRELVDVSQPLGMQYVVDGVKLISNLSANVMVRKRELIALDLDAHTMHFREGQSLQYSALACASPLDDIIAKSSLADKRSWPRLTDGLAVTNVGGMKRKPWLPSRVVRIECQGHAIVDRIDVFSNVSRRKFTPTYDGCDFRVSLSAMRRVPSTELRPPPAFKHEVARTLSRWGLCDVAEVVRSHWHPYFYARDEEEARLEALDALSKVQVYQIGGVGCGMGRAELAGHDLVADVLDGLTVGAAIAI